MITTAGKHLPAGTRVRVSQPGPVPCWSTWDDDGQRTSSSVKKRLQRLFFSGDRKIHAEVVFIPSESERDRLRSLGRVKVQVRDPAGSSIVVTADATELRVA
jgi:hypothetical protein